MLESRSALSLPKGLWYVYVLVCSDKSLYTGYSNKPNARLADHINGSGAKYTRSHKPIKRIYLEQLNSKSEALKRERQIKGWTRLKKIQILKLSL